ncbi:MAG: tetratricopeptide repeat protein [Woeseiaceae bacterium]|nr:tetratricopeptide repeat protein [Woeseiaceae bacterium]
MRYVLSLRGLLIASILMLTACGQSTEQARQAEHAGDPAAKDSQHTTITITTASEKARSHYKAGQKLLDGLHFTDANAEFKAAVEADPEFAMGHLMVASTALSNSEFFAALRRAEQTIDSATEGEQLWIRSALAQAANDPGLQEDILEELVEKFPNDPRSLFRYGNFLNGQQDFESAIELYNRAVTADPKFAPAYNAMGYAFRSIENLEAAAGAFESYVEASPNEANPLDSYAELLLEQGDLDSAIKNYRKAIAIEPNFPSAYTGILIAQSLQGNSDAAMATANQMLSVARNFAERQGALFRTATVNIMAGDNEAAVKNCETMAANATEEGNHAALGNIHEYMGDIHLHANDAQRAAEHFDLALDHRYRSDSNDAAKAAAERAHVYKMALVAMVADEIDTAANLTAEYTAAAEARGNAFEKRRIHALKGFLAMVQDDMELGAKHLSRANQFNPAVVYWRGVAEAELGNTDKAVDLITRTATRNVLHPQFPMMQDEALTMLEKLAT